jgi:dephospho-CoA kinase
VTGFAESLQRLSGSQIPPKFIGLVGGVASGKSLVAQQLHELGAAVLDADRAGHDVLRMPEVEAAIRQRWGPQVFGSDDRVDRRRLADVVFAQEERQTAGDGCVDGAPSRGELAYLEQLTHPRIGQLMVEQAQQAVAAGARCLVLDAPLLLKAGWDKFCDKVVFVDVPREVRLARARGRGWTEAEFTQRENSQESIEMKRTRADVIIDNSTSPDSTRVQVEQLWHSLIG